MQNYKLYIILLLGFLGVESCINESGPSYSDTSSLSLHNLNPIKSKEDLTKSTFDLSDSKEGLNNRIAAISKNNNGILEVINETDIKAWYTDLYNSGYCREDFFIKGSMDPKKKIESLKAKQLAILGLLDICRQNNIEAYKANLLVQKPIDQCFNIKPKTNIIDIEYIIKTANEDNDIKDKINKFFDKGEISNLAQFKILRLLNKLFEEGSKNPQYKVEERLLNDGKITESKSSQSDNKSLTKLKKEFQPYTTAPRA